MDSYKITNLKPILLKTNRIFRIILKISFWCLPLVWLSACQQDACDQWKDYNEVSVEIPVEHLEDELGKLESWEEVVLFLGANRVMADYFLDANQYPNDTILAKRLYGLMRNPHIDTLFTEVGEYFEQFDQENLTELESAYRVIKHHYPDVVMPRIQTIITGQYNDLYVSDSLIVLGLDFFMGLNAKYPPNDVPMYIVKRYMKESVAPIVLSFVSNEFNYIDTQHGTLLADMINVGKSYYFVSTTLPCKPDSLIIGYTDEEMNLVEQNQEVIWASFIQNEVLYETDHAIKNKFVGEAPNVYEIDEKCPGRVGAWIGWQIVRKYMENNSDVSLQQLMRETDAHKIFQQSGYKPRNL